jgi:hypothetical protein
MPSAKVFLSGSLDVDLEDFLTAAQFIAGDDDDRRVNAFIVQVGAVRGLQVFHPPLVVMEAEAGVPGSDRFVG